MAGGVDQWRIFMDEGNSPSIILDLRNCETKLDRYSFPGRNKLETFEKLSLTPPTPTPSKFESVFFTA